MSWHLQMLGRHGFVSEAEGARGRRRPWQLTALGTRWDPQPQSPQERAAADALDRTTAERAVGQLRAWLASRHTAQPAWQRAADISDWTLYLTAAETSRLREQIYELLEQFGDRIEHPKRRPAGAVAVRAFVALHPQRPPRARR
jgi:hypothetical protein